MNFIEFIKTNFFHILPILICGVFALAIVIERANALYKIYPINNSEDFFDKISALVMKSKIKEAIALCDRYPQKPAAQVVKQGLLRCHQPEELIENGVAISMNKNNEEVQKRTAYLATIANVVTLLGLFGTIAGLITSFEAVGQADAQQKAAILAAGISMAMNATLMGLGVAIPCMIAFSFLMGKTNQISNEIEGSASQIMDVLKQRFYTSEDEKLAEKEVGSE